MIAATKSARMDAALLRALERFANTARRAVKLRGEVEVLLAGDTDVRKLNRRFRGKDKTTDVLSFPAAIKGCAGDIVISSSRARAQARQFGHSTADEIKILLLHGLLHLAGMDHERDNGAMHRREEALRRKLDLPNGLIARAHSLHGAHAARSRKSPR